MSISSSGVFSGINTGQIIEQLLAISGRPKTLAQRRLVQLQGQQAAFLDINGRLSGLKTAATKFGTANVFRSARVTSSDTNVLTATASPGAAPGTYSFIVDRTVTSQQLLSRGFTDRNQTGIGATRFTIEPAQGRVERDTSLTELNGGQGISRGRILVTDSSGASATVDLSRAGTVGEVLEAINTATGVQVRASVDGGAFVLSDNAGGSGRLTIADAAGYTTATSLGIAGQASSTGSGTLTGQRVFTMGNSTLISSLNDGLGVRISSTIGTATPDFRITDALGNVHAIDIGDIWASVTDPDTGESRFTRTATAVTNVRELLDRINSQTGGAVTASVGPDGYGLRLTDTTGGGGTLTVAEVSGNTATDLGILGDSASGTLDGRRILAGMNTTLVKSLFGGSGLSDGAFSVVARDGSAYSFSLNTNGTVDELIRAIGENTDGKITASLSPNGTGLVLNDTTGGSGALRVSGAAALALGFQTPLSGIDSSTLTGNKLQVQYIGEATPLTSLNGGRGIGTGSFVITDAQGRASTVAIGSDARTLGDVIMNINSRGLNVRARINDNGDGILVEDYPPTASGAKITITDQTGTVARSLNLAGEARDTGSGNRIDGSYERALTFSATDTLDQVVQKINAANAGVTATIINDGNPGAPFRLSITSNRTGSAGRFILDSGDLDLNLTTISRGDDARVFYGSTDPARGLLLSSTTNTFDGVIANVKIDAAAPSNGPVTLTVSQDTSAIENAVQEFVDSFNEVVSRIATLTEYNAATERKGTLMGEGTAIDLRLQLFNAVNGRAQGISGEFQFLSQVGIRVGRGGELTINSEEFRAALAQNPEAVAELISAKTARPRETREISPGVIDLTPQPETYSALGIAEQVARLVDSFITSETGTLSRRREALDQQIKLQNDRIVAFDRQLGIKREILERQFAAMERSIAQLQGQQGSIASLANLAASISLR